MNRLMHHSYLIEKVAEEFWLLVGQAPEYPCDIEEALCWALPLDIRLIPALRVRDAHAWAQQAGIVHRLPEYNRRLRGCLLAYKNHGTILLDALDPVDERRFTLAHEAAHFLLDYHAPRQRALAALGESIRPVLDGQRPPTLKERLYAVLADAPLGVLSHLMERPDEGLPAPIVLDVEDRADRLALELLAPAQSLLDLLRHPSVPRTFDARLAYLTTILVTKYGLPAPIAASYARFLLQLKGGPGFRDWLLGRAMAISAPDEP
jgi:hypothetical protein